MKAWCEVSGEGFEAVWAEASVLSASSIEQGQADRVIYVLVLAMSASDVGHVYVYVRQKKCRRKINSAAAQFCAAAEYLTTFREGSSMAMRLLPETEEWYRVRGTFK
jgi:hypothetical protein